MPNETPTQADIDAWRLHMADTDHAKREEQKARKHEKLLASKRPEYLTSVQRQCMERLTRGEPVEPAYLLSLRKRKLVRRVALGKYVVTTEGRELLAKPDLSTEWRQVEIDPE